MSNQIAVESEMDIRRASLGAEPGSDVPSSSIATIRFQTPTGAKLTRKFQKTDLVERMYDYILLHFYDLSAQGPCNNSSNPTSNSNNPSSNNSNPSSNSSNNSNNSSNSSNCNNNSNKMRNILISINVPKQDLEDRSVTIESVGLYPRGVVFVQDLDA